MSRAEPTDHEPLVSVLATPGPGADDVAETVASLTGQTYGQFEALVLHTDGSPVPQVLRHRGDARLVPVRVAPEASRGMALAVGLARAKGRAIATLDAPDRWYADHLAAHVAALKSHSDCGATTSDFYRTAVRTGPDGRREALAKTGIAARAFDPFFLCYAPPALPAATVMGRDLVDRVGGYNPAIDAGADWDLTRRIGLVAPSAWVPRITGETLRDVSDPPVHTEPKARAAWLSELLAIRASRPAKPWPMMPDLAIFYLPDQLGPAEAAAVPTLYAWTFAPMQVFIVAPADGLALVHPDAPNCVRLACDPGADLRTRLDLSVAGAAGADFVAIVPEARGLGPLWVEDALHAAHTAPTRRTAFTLPGHRPDRPAVLLAREALAEALDARPGAPLAEALSAAGITVRGVRSDERALQFDRMLLDAELLEADGNLVQAAYLYEEIGRRHGHGRWMRECAARALYRAGHRDRQAQATCADLNRREPTPSSLLLEARIHKRADRLEQAVALLERADRIIEGKGGTCNS